MPENVKNLILTPNTVAINRLWSTNVEHSFNRLVFGRVFGHTQPVLIIGHEDSIVRTYQLVTGADKQHTTLKSTSTLESKGGPIQLCCIHDVTRLHGNDVVVGDSCGTVTVFCNGQILHRKAVSQHCLQCLQVQQDALGNIAIITGDREGHINAFSAYRDLWRVRLTDTLCLKGVGRGLPVKSLLAVRLNNAHGQPADYVLAADNARHLYFIQQGQIVLVLNTPASVTSMCAGKFVDPSNIEIPNSTDPTPASNLALQTQIAMATETGAIYVMTNFEVYSEEFANVKLPVTQLCRLPPSDLHPTDFILCAGNFNALCVLRDGKEVSRYKTPAWINSIVTCDADRDGVMDVIIGCHDKSIHGLKVTVS